MHLLSSRRTHSLWAALVGLLVTCGGFAQVQPDCNSASVRCVGAGREYTSIGAAAAAVRPGDLVYVFDGNYAGFRVTVSGSASAPIVFRAAGNVVISSSGPTGDGIRFDNVSYVTVDGFHIQNVSQRCIAARNGSPTAPMVGLTIRNNSCTSAGLEGFYLSEVKSSLVENNVVFGLTGSRGHGIYLANAGSDNTIVRNNRIYNISGTDAAGIHANGDLSVGGDGIISGIVLDRNLIYSIKFNGVSFDGVQNAILRNNVIYGTARHAVRAFRIDGAQGPKGLTIVNNTLVSAGAWAIKLTEDLGGHVVFNNILLGGGSGGSLAVANANLKSAANVVGARFSRDGEQTTVNLATWQSWGYDTGSVTGSATQLFRNPSAGDYHLLAGAPAVNRGLASFAGVVAPAVDRDGITRPQGGAFDIGAYGRCGDIART